MYIKYSRLQISIFGLYRRLIRACEGRAGFKEYIQAEFRKNAIIPRSNILRIEYLMRRGEKQLKDLQRTEMQSISVMKPGLKRG
jgi:succinate dehydrogenase assembly factor 1